MVLFHHHGHPGTFHYNMDFQVQDKTYRNKKTGIGKDGPGKDCRSKEEKPGPGTTEKGDNGAGRTIVDFLYKP